MPSITAVAVIIPARDEEELLPACLDAVAASARVVDVPVHVVVALDSCRDGTAGIVRARPWVTSVELDAGSVGAARAAAAATALTVCGEHGPEELWLACTDADSTVPVDWLSTQLQLAADGWEVTVGTVDVDDWSGHPDDARRAWRDGYQPVEHHPHIHGANLGLTAAAYLAAGGFPPLPLGEDVALVGRLAGRRVIRTASHGVLTSARTSPRASGGFGDYLRSVAG
ncbi:MAG TPA: glycosyltransferase [Mycobacteriales bacterium]|nr:glycosyltransferase [Mycobacteriales bacterium]